MTVIAIEFVLMYQVFSLELLMAVKKARKLNKGRGTYQVTFNEEDREFLELLLKCSADGPRLYISKMMTDLLRVARHHYFQDKTKFIEHYGPTFFGNYFAKLDKLRKLSDEHKRN